MPKRLPETAEGSTPVMAIRLPQRTFDLLDALIASLPPNPLGLPPPPRVMVVRAVIDAGIEAIARREGIKLPQGVAEGSIMRLESVKAEVGRIAKRNNATLNGTKLTSGPMQAAQVPEAPKPHHGTLARSQKRAAERKAAGCTCKGKHLASCKLSKRAHQA